MARLLIIAILVYLGYLIARKFGKQFLSSSDKESSEEPAAEDAELIQDPHCGAYFLRQRGVKTIIDGKQVYFCSEACQKKYIERHRR